MSQMYLHLFDGAPEQEVWWRAVGHCVSEGFYDVSAGPRVEVVYVPFRVIRHTPCGVRLDDGTENGRFVLRGARKRFACPTKSSRCWPKNLCSTRRPDPWPAPKRSSTA